MLLPVEIRIFGPKKAKFYPNMLSWAHIGLAVSFGALLVCGCGAQGCISQDTYLLYNDNNNQTRNDTNIRTLKFDSLAFASRW